MLLLSISPVADTIFVRLTKGHSAKDSRGRSFAAPCILTPAAKIAVNMAGRRSATRLRKELNRGASQACASAGLYDSTQGPPRATRRNRLHAGHLAAKLANQVNIYFDGPSPSAQIHCEEVLLNQPERAVSNGDRKAEPVATSYSQDSETSALWKLKSLERAYAERGESINDGRVRSGDSVTNDLHSRAEAASAANGDRLLPNRRIS